MGERYYKQTTITTQYEEKKEKFSENKGTEKWMVWTKASTANHWEPCAKWNVYSKYWYAYAL